MDYSAVRRFMEMMEKGMNAGIEPATPETEFYHEIPMRDGFISKLKLHKPAAGSAPGPLIVLCFGGGFVSGTCDQYTKTARHLIKLFGATVVSISYRLAPEYKFPYGQLDAWDSMKWIATNATGDIINSDPTKGFLMGGVSAGGSLTASLSRMFQDEPLAHPLTGLWLAVPSMMEAEIVPEEYKPYYMAHEQMAEGRFLSKRSRDALRALCEWDVNSPLRCAINAKSPPSGEPPAFFQVDGMDPLRDDALIYEEMLKLAGVSTRIEVYYGCPHGHFCGFPGLKITNRANIDTLVGFGWLLGKEVSREDAASVLGVPVA